MENENESDDEVDPMVSKCSYHNVVPTLHALLGHDCSYRAQEVDETLRQQSDGCGLLPLLQCSANWTARGEEAF